MAVDRNLQQLRTDVMEIFNHVLQSLDIQGRSKDEFLISPPEAFSPNGHGGLPSGDDTGGWADRVIRFYDFLCNSGMDSGCLPRLPLYKGREDEGVISQFPCPLLRRLDLSFLPGVARPCEEPSQDDTDKKGAQEHKRIGDGPLPREKMNINNLGILVSKDDDQDS
ncbi:unnamed protein product [marine sediment metagenome]|uniref:Uncharacterized protein n=1 Tax=marine sediment metagenome TaxID=412755 RepID=X1S0L3_9ZZZZ